MTQESGKFKQHDDNAANTFSKINTLYEEVMSFYIANRENLNATFAADYNRLNNVQSTDDLYSWAYDLKRDVQNISFKEFMAMPMADNAGVPKEIIGKTLELAEAIQGEKESSLKRLFADDYTFSNSLKVIDDTKNKLIDLYNKVHENDKENTVLFKTSEGYVAVGKDAYDICRLNNEWNPVPLHVMFPTKEQDRNIPVMFLNKDGYSILSEQEINLRVTKPSVSLDKIQLHDYLLEGIKKLNEARQTVQYFCEINPQHSVVVNVGGKIVEKPAETKEENKKRATVDKLLIAEGKMTAVISDWEEKPAIRKVDKDGIIQMPFKFADFADFLNANRKELEKILSNDEKILQQQTDNGLENYFQKKRLKGEYPDALILLKTNSVYMAYDNDAVKIARETGARLYNREMTRQGDNRLFACIDAQQYVNLTASANNVYVAKAVKPERQLLWNVNPNNSVFNIKENPSLNIKSASVKPTKGGNWAVFAKVGDKLYSADIKPADAKAYRETSAAERDVKAREIATTYLMRKITDNQISVRQHSNRR